MADINSPEAAAAAGIQYPQPSPGATLAEGMEVTTLDGGHWRYHAGVLGGNGLPLVGGGNYWTYMGGAKPTQGVPGGVSGESAGTGGYQPPQPAAGAQGQPPAGQGGQFGQSDALAIIEAKVGEAQARMGNPSTQYNQVLANPDAYPPDTVKAMQDMRSADLDTVMRGSQFAAQEYDRRTKAQAGALTPKEAAEIDARIKTYDLQGQAAALQIQQETLKLQIAQNGDPDGSLAKQAALLANQGAQVTNAYNQAQTEHQKLVDAYTPQEQADAHAKMAADINASNASTQGQQNVNDWYGPTAAAGINQSQAQTAASLAELAVHEEELRRARQGDVESYAQDLDTAVRAGRMTRVQALALLDDKLQGTTPFQREQEANKNLIDTSNQAMQGGMLFAPGQAQAIGDAYNQLGAQYGAPQMNVPHDTAMNVPQYVQSLGVNTESPYRMAGRGVAPPQAAGSLGMGTDIRGMDMKAVVRALDAWSASGGKQAPVASMPQQPNLFPVAPPQATSAPRVAVPNTPVPPVPPPPANTIAATPPSTPAKTAAPLPTANRRAPARDRTWRQQGGN